MEKKEFNKKKVITIAAISAAVVAVGGAIYAFLKRGHVDTEQITDTIEDALDQAAEAVEDFTEA